ncbi:MAG: inositol monophosphatase family protein [Patescibacteria group bacterium]
MDFQMAIDLADEFRPQLLTLLFEFLMEFTPVYIGTTHSPRGDKIKNDGTPVGNLDVLAGKKLKAIIQRRFPGDVVLAEEDKRDPQEIGRILADQTSRIWTVDGLDGTGNRSMRLLSYGAAVALRQGGQILFAFIFRPADEILRGDGMFWAGAGMGAWMRCREHGEDHQLRTAKMGELERMTVLLEGSSKKFFHEPIVTLGRAITTRASVSSSVAATTVALAKASAVVTVENAPWDNWPMWLMIQEAGGVATDWRGNPLTPENCGNMVAAANPEDHAMILRILKQGLTTKLLAEGS